MSDTGNCTWTGPCAEAGVHPVWSETRPGLIVHLDVCGQHLPLAARRGYRTDAPPIPAPRCGWSIVCDRWPVYQLDRVQFRGAPVEHVDVCDTHLPHARAKGYRPPQPRSLPRPPRGG